jgi:hypothetical protein
MTALGPNGHPFDRSKPSLEWHFVVTRDKTPPPEPDMGSVLFQVESKCPARIIRMLHTKAWSGSASSWMRNAPGNLELRKFSGREFEDGIQLFMSEDFENESRWEGRGRDRQTLKVSGRVLTFTESSRQTDLSRQTARALDYCDVIAAPHSVVVIS